MSFTKKYTAYPEIRIEDGKNCLNWVARLYQPQKQDPNRPLTQPGIPDKVILEKSGSVPCDLSDKVAYKAAYDECRTAGREALAVKLAECEKPKVETITADDVEVVKLS